MDFAQQLKKLRTDRGLTQEQLAASLNVSRQAVSNWENNKNLPDLELIVQLAITFDLSLDQLILGGKSVNKIIKKLIQDGSAGRRARLNLITISLGALLLLVGLTRY